jgi:hypothetical protein
MLVAARDVGGSVGAVALTALLGTWWCTGAAIERDLVWGGALLATLGALFAAAAALDGTRPWRRCSRSHSCRRSRTCGSRSRRA